MTAESAESEPTRPLRARLFPTRWRGRVLGPAERTVDGYDESGVPVQKRIYAKDPKTGKRLVIIRPYPRDAGVGGYRQGSAAEMAAQALVEGGFSSGEITRRLLQEDPDRNWYVTISTVKRDLIERGFQPEGWYRLVPPPIGGSGRMARLVPKRR